MKNEIFSPSNLLTFRLIDKKKHPNHDDKTFVMSSFFHPNRHGYSVRFSPFDANRLIVATSQCYGLAGGGTLYLLELVPNTSGLVSIKTFEWSDGLFDVVWSEQNPNFALSAAGDGSLQLWNISAENRNVPECCYQEHTKEVYSVDWCKNRQEQLILSASWDSTIKLWDPIRKSSLNTYIGHDQLVYSAKFSFHSPNTLASVSGDGCLKLWNLLDKRPVASVKAHDAEVLTCDWSNIDPNIIATGGSDSLIRGWDIRRLTVPIFELYGSEYAVRRIQFSPYSSSILASVGYDFKTRIWDFKRTVEPIETIRHHSEFTYGLDWNRLRMNQLADCGWDSLVHVFMPKTLSTP